MQQKKAVLSNILCPQGDIQNNSFYKSPYGHLKKTAFFQNYAYNRKQFYPIIVHTREHPKKQFLEVPLYICD
jgi:hypothetical protein